MTTPIHLITLLLLHVIIGFIAFGVTLVCLGAYLVGKENGGISGTWVRVSTTSAIIAVINTICLIIESIIL